MKLDISSLTLDNLSMPESRTPPTVQPGSHVLVELLDSSGETRQLEFDLVPEESADFSRGYLGLTTPSPMAVLHPLFVRGDSHPVTNKIDTHSVG